MMGGALGLAVLASLAASRTDSLRAAGDGRAGRADRRLPRGVPRRRDLRDRRGRDRRHAAARDRRHAPAGRRARAGAGIRDRSVDRAQERGHRVGRGQLADAPQPRGAGLRVAEAPADGGGERLGVAGAARARRGRRARAARPSRWPRRARRRPSPPAAARPKVSAEREGTIASAAPARRSASSAAATRPDEARRRAAARSARGRAGRRRRPRAARPPARRPRSRPRRPSRAPAATATSACSPAARRERSAKARTTWRHDVHARRLQRRAELAQALRARSALGTTTASACGGQAPLPERQRGGVDGGLGAGPAAVQAHAGQRVAAVAARAVLAAA